MSLQQIRRGNREVDDDARDIDKRGDKRAGSVAGVDAQPPECRGEHSADERPPQTMPAMAWPMTMASVARSTLPSTDCGVNTTRMNPMTPSVIPSSAPIVNS